MPYAVYEALLMGVPVVAFPIGGQAELISQTPSAQFTAEDTSAKAYIKAAVRAAAVPRQEMEKLRKITAETIATQLVQESLYTIFKAQMH
jgi:glycosyltransferase involved in cell wall biosynthesis